MYSEVSSFQGVRIEDFHCNSYHAKKKKHFTFPKLPFPKSFTNLKSVRLKCLNDLLCTNGLCCPCIEGDTLPFDR